MTTTSGSSIAETLEFDRITETALRVRRELTGSELETPCSVHPKIHYGSFYTVVQMIFEDGEKWVMKLPNSYFISRWDDAKAKQMSYAANIKRWVKKNTTIPVPAVHWYDHTFENEISRPFVIEEMIEGVRPSRAWADKSVDSEILVLRMAQITHDIAKAMVELSTVSFKKIGAPEFDVDGNFSGAVGPMVGNKLVDDGPYDSIKSYFQDRIISYDLPSDFYSIWAKAFLGWAEAQGEHQKIALSHFNLSGGNFLVDRATGQLKGIVDFEAVGAVPLACGVHSYPSFLMRDWIPSEELRDKFDCILCSARVLALEDSSLCSKEDLRRHEASDYSRHMWRRCVEYYIEDPTRLDPEQNLNASQLVKENTSWNESLPLSGCMSKKFLKDATDYPPNLRPTIGHIFALIWYLDRSEPFPHPPLQKECRDAKKTVTNTPQIQLPPYPQFKENFMKGRLSQDHIHVIKAWFLYLLHSDDRQALDTELKEPAQLPVLAREAFEGLGCHTQEESDQAWKQWCETRNFPYRHYNETAGDGSLATFASSTSEEVGESSKGGRMDSMRNIFKDIRLSIKKKRLQPLLARVANKAQRGVVLKTGRVEELGEQLRQQELAIRALEAKLQEHEALIEELQAKLK